MPSTLEISASSISERDIDLLLLEEFVASVEFAEWFYQSCAKSPMKFGAVTRAKRSVTSSLGESDLEVDIEDQDGQLLRLMIENKVNAGFQPTQSDRYRERGEAYVQRGEISSFQTILVSPHGYFTGDSKGFDTRLDYEAILDWFEALCTPRSTYKAYLLQSAIEKSSSGYQAIEDENVSAFWRDYWHLLHKTAPDLDMPEPSIRPSGSSFVYFRTPSLPKDVSLVHKLTHGYVDLQLGGKNQQIPQLRQLLHHNMPPAMTLTTAGKSAALRMEVPVLELNETVASQEASTRRGIESAELIQKWATHYLPDVLARLEKHGDD